MNHFANRDGRALADALVQAIQEKAAWLSDLDGAIGDGDHGINMKKGFTLAATRWSSEVDLAGAFMVLGETLMDEIGGAMGPLYGSFFLRMGRRLRGEDPITGEVFASMLAEGQDAIQALGGARVGDKTLIDVLDPAVRAFRTAWEQDQDFSDALEALSVAAEAGREATRDMVAQIGRASRLGERSRGVLDAGAASCALLLQSMAAAAQTLLKKGNSHEV